MECPRSRKSAAAHATRQKNEDLGRDATGSRLKSKLCVPASGETIGELFACAFVTTRDPGICVDEQQSLQSKSYLRSERSFKAIIVEARTYRNNVQT